MNKLLITFITILLQFHFGFSQESETRSVDDFHGVKVSSSLDAYLVKGDKNEVRIEVSNYELDEIESEIHDGILKLKIDSKGNWGSNWKKKKAVVTVTYKGELDYIQATGSSDLYGKSTITGDYLKIKLNGSSDAELDVDVNKIHIDVNASSDLDISGRAEEANITANASSDMRGRQLEVDNAEISANASSDVYIHVNDSIKAKANASADIEYWGDPKHKDISKRASGSVTKR